MEENFGEITKEMATKGESVLLLEKIAVVERLIFKNPGTPLSERAKEKIGGDFWTYLKKIEKEKLISGSPSQQLSFFEKIKKYILEMPMVKLEIAFEPSKHFLLKIKNWLKENGHRDIIFDLTINPKIAGGAIMEYRGRYRNFSLAKKIDELISQKNEE